MASLSKAGLTLSVADTTPDELDRGLRVAIAHFLHAGTSPLQAAIAHFKRQCWIINGYEPQSEPSDAEMDQADLWDRVTEDSIRACRHTWQSAPEYASLTLTLWSDADIERASRDDSLPDPSGREP